MLSSGVVSMPRRSSPGSSPLGRRSRPSSSRCCRGTSAFAPAAAPSRAPAGARAPPAAPAPAGATRTSGRPARPARAACRPSPTRISIVRPMSWIASSRQRTMAAATSSTPTGWIRASAPASAGAPERSSLQRSEQIEEAIALAEDHRRPQHGQIETPAAQRRFAARLRAQVLARRVDVRAERADMDDAAHAGAAARLGEPLRQANVDALELGLAAVQDRDEIDHRVGVAQHPGERVVVVDVADGELDRGQQLQVTCPRAMPCCATRIRPSAPPARSTSLSQTLPPTKPVAPRTRRLDTSRGRKACATGAGGFSPSPDRCQGRSFSGGGAFGSGGPIVSPESAARRVVPRPPRRAA